MTEFTIQDDDLVSLKGQVVVLTGCSSGIGLATTKLLLDIGAFVVGGDLNPAPLEHTHFTFVKASVTSWTDLSTLFRTAKDKHGHIDHAFANAGVGANPTYLEESFDESGNLLEPDQLVYDVNFRGVINTCALAIHYIRQQANGGSIVITASAASFQPFRFVDYGAAKHGVLGYMRGMVPNFKAHNLAIRMNAIAPSWTVTGMVPQNMVGILGKGTQSAEVPARSVALLMADAARQGQLIYSWEGRYKEAEELLRKGVNELLADDIPDDSVAARLVEAASKSVAEDAGT